LGDLFGDYLPSFIPKDFIFMNAAVIAMALLVTAFHIPMW
jgi:hypothetical protein